MNEFKFKPQDFCNYFPDPCPNGHVISDYHEYCDALRNAEIANAKLTQWLEDAPVVFGRIGTHASTWSSHPPGTFIQENNTHKARLVCIEPIGEGEKE